jgi:hypothetical protein
MHHQQRKVFPFPAIPGGDKYKIADTEALPAGMAEVTHGKEFFNHERL